MEKTYWSIYALLSFQQHQQHSIKTEHTYASEDSGACDADSETKRAHKSQQTTAPEPSYESEVCQKVKKNYFHFSVHFVPEM